MLFINTVVLPSFSLISFKNTHTHTQWAGLLTDAYYVGRVLRSAVTFSLDLDALTKLTGTEVTFQTERASGRRRCSSEILLY
jgi:hypothetical protein